MTILSICNLLVSGIGGFDEDVFDVHSEGLVRIILHRGGLSKLPENLAKTITMYVVYDLY